jgi:hypothetical protein
MGLHLSFQSTDRTPESEAPEALITSMCPSLTSSADFGTHCAILGLTYFEATTGAVYSGRNNNGAQDGAGASIPVEQWSLQQSGQILRAPLITWHVSPIP